MSWVDDVDNWNAEWIMAYSCTTVDRNNVPGLRSKGQHVLAPHYVAAIGITGQEESQAYQVVVPATEKTYLPLCLSGNTAPPAPTGRTQPLLRAAG